MLKNDESKSYIRFKGIQGLTCALENKGLQVVQIKFSILWNMAMIGWIKFSSVKVPNQFATCFVLIDVVPAGRWGEAHMLQHVGF